MYGYKSVSPDRSSSRVFQHAESRSEDLRLVVVGAAWCPGVDASSIHAYV
jgi:hypothetical protein